MTITQRKLPVVQHRLSKMTLALCVLQGTLAQASTNIWDLSLEELGKVRVTTIASGTATPLDKASAVATVITAADIEAMGATDLDEVLETVPGLHVTRSQQSYAGRYIIRGITSTYNPQALVLINGVPVTSLFTGNRGNIWGGMPVKAIARVEVIRGPGSALYGADAFAGVINIVTKNGKDLKDTQATVRVGSFNTQAVSVAHGGQYAGLELGFVIEAQRTDGWKKTVHTDAQTVLDKLLATQASLAPNTINTAKDMLDTRLDIASDNARLRLGYQGRYNVESSVGYAEALDPSSHINSQRYNVDYSYSLKELAPQLDVDIRTSYYRNTQEVKANILLYPKGAFGGDFPEGFIGNPGYLEENARIDLSALYKGMDNHLFRVGSGFTWDDMFEVTETKNFMVAFLPSGAPVFPPRPNGIDDVSDTAEVYLPESQRKNYYFFIQDEWKFAPNWQATTGVRYDHFSDFGDTTNPRLALVWAATEKITTKLLYGKAFRAPAFSELFVTSNPIALGNPNLTPETIDTYELAFSHQLSKDMLYTANIYHYRINDFISFVPTSCACGVNQAQNLGNIEGHGLELELDYSVLENWRILANYAYQKSIDQNTDADVGEAPNHQIYLRNEWTVASGVFFDAQLTWVGKQQRVLGDMRDPVSDYTTVDLTLRKHDILTGFDMSLSIRNAFNADIREPSPRSSLPTNEHTGSIPNDFPMAGRSLYAELSYLF
ncbi:TonB-dependent receptor plug domain-containing protein [Agitococcus lubricus]|uniref:Iron complex outermembrane receptor protein n=1 Tax=Agitococcus lubricus TaxID=1077255 RepID=A0A2T5IY09_9GAMM|nr:TonB-dependent receptor [Agitococcus lubricus]PTQ88858.1 iron complex outermembrane receptor protein [Agitococcus lubricus]